MAVVLAGCGGGTTSSPAPTISMTVSGPATDRLNATAQFSATVVNSQNQAVTWQVNGVSGGSTASGTISGVGLYTAPSALPSSPTVTVTAISQASATANASSALSLQNPLPTLSSGTATEVGATLNYVFDVQGSGFVPTSVLTAGGTAQATTYVSGGELKATVAVASGAASELVSVTNPDPGGSTSSTLTISVSGTTPTVTVSGGSSVRVTGTVQFSATVSLIANQNVAWQVNGVAGGNATLGTISPGGLYTAPAAIPSPNTLTVTAVSQANSAYAGTASLAVLNPLPVLTSGTIGQVANTLQSFLVDVKGAGFLPTSVINTTGAQTTTFVSATELQATVSVALNAATVPVTVTNANPGGSTSAPLTLTVNSKITTPTAAARLLDQMTFGPTVTDIAHVESIGIDAYITEQFGQTASLIPAFNPANTLRPAYCQPPEDPHTCVSSPWWQNVVQGPDQFRQRLAFALSQLFVVSDLGNAANAQGLPQYINLLANDSFTNFYTIMHDVTVSPSMGEYLNVLNSGAPVNGEIANENFARENMQLFTMGTSLLNQDGSLQTDSNGNPIPAYTQNQVQAFARAFTGWTYASSTGGSNTKFPSTTVNYSYLMMPVDAQHDTGSKALLNGTVLPAGQTSVQDLTGALTNVFTHNNVPPFISLQLIQHLVTSTPSPAYVSRIAAVFTNNGNGVRGDMQSVLRAILEDPEARAGDTDATANDGRLREPVLFMTDMLRALNFSNTSTADIWWNLSSQTGSLSESPFQSPSVFNFFPPSYVIPQSTLNAPEFGIENTATVILRLTMANTAVFNNFTNFNVDLSATSSLGVMAATPSTLVDYLGMEFMYSQMPTAMRTNIINTITPITDNAKRVRVALYLVLTSSNYKIIH
jgi:uncharacterized protein (DUF1800 family)